jgi:hypothetical protein
MKNIVHCSYWKKEEIENGKLVTVNKALMILNEIKEEEVETKFYKCLYLYY